MYICAHMFTKMIRTTCSLDCNTTESKSWVLHGKQGFATVQIDVAGTLSHLRPYTQASFSRPGVIMFPSEKMALNFKNRTLRNKGDGYTMTIISLERGDTLDTYINTFEKATAILYNHDDNAQPRYDFDSSDILDDFDNCLDSLDSLDGLDRLNRLDGLDSLDGLTAWLAGDL